MTKPQGDRAMQGKPRSLGRCDLTSQLGRMLGGRTVLALQDEHHAQDIQRACGDPGAFRGIDGPPDGKR